MRETTEAEARHIALDVRDTLSNAMGRKLQAMGGRPSPEDPCTIHRILAKDRSAYEPRMLPIGPYHHRNPASQSMEDHKWRFLRDLLSRSPGSTLDAYIRAVKLVELRARSCYSEPIGLNGDEFAELMVLDGCFIIEFLIKWCSSEQDPLFAVGWNLPIIRTDLLMLENQIPFLVLRCLFDASLIHDTPPLAVLAANYLMRGADPDVISRISSVSVHNLLHLFHLCLVRPPRPKKPSRSPLRSDKRSPRAIPSATEMKEAGVRFKRKAAAAAASFLDVSFKDGTMEIPHVSIEYATKCRFQNLIAFEQCYPDAGNHLTSYSVFMDCLVNTPEDVIVLQRCGILESKLGSDDDAAVFFNQVCECGYLDYEDHYLAGLFRDVADYCESDWHQWRAKLKRDYFSNPWTVLSLAAAVALLVLTFIQAFYAVYTYYRPR